MNTITIRTDEACEMACVELNGERIMMGNFWDFHPNCHGIHEYGHFNSYAQLANNIKLKFGGEVMYDFTWKYDE